jgi:hypothetical protein
MNCFGRSSFCVAVAALFFAAALPLQSQALADSRSLPDSSALSNPSALLEAASAKEDAYAIERQNYSCVFKNDKFTLHAARLYESFYVNGREIQRLLAVSDVSLTAQQKEAEEARVQAEIAADEQKPMPLFVGLAGGMWISSGEHRWSDTVEGAIVHAANFKNERRVVYRERPAIQIDFDGNAKFRPHTPEESIARAMAGTFLVDEESSAIVRVDAQAMADVYHHGELMVVHGAHIGFDATRIADNLWLPSSWVSFRMVTNRWATPQFYPDTEDFWLQSCRRTANGAGMPMGSTPAK